MSTKPPHVAAFEADQTKPVRLALTGWLMEVAGDYGGPSARYGVATVSIAYRCGSYDQTVTLKADLDEIRLEQALPPEPYDIAVLVAQRDAAEARAVAAEALARKLAEDARLLLDPVIRLPAGVFLRRPHLFRPIFGAIAEAVKP